MKNVVKKLNWVLPNVTSKMNFTQSNVKNMDKQQSAYGVLSKFLKDYMLLPLPYT